MSHFVFGVVVGERAYARQNVGPSFDVCWGPPLQQAVVMRMLEKHGKPAPNETPFSLSLAGEDHADGLVSPYQIDREPIVTNVAHLLTWLDRERAGEDAELWLTEGYDDAFRELQGTQPELNRQVRELLQTSDDVPSLRLKMTSRRVSSSQS